MSSKYELEEEALQAIANKLVLEHGLNAPVSIFIDGRLSSRYGTAYYARRMILISAKLLDYPSELNNTLRHELAHHLAYDRYGYVGHGKPWRLCAIELGARPQQYESFTFDTKLDGTRYHYECPEGCKAYASRIRPRFERGLCLTHGLPFTRYRV